MSTLKFAHAVLVEGYGPVLEDRATVIEAGEVLVIAVADGAGGRPNGDRAAEHVVRELEGHVRRGVPLDDELAWTRFLTVTDRAIARDPRPGETTAVVLAVTSDWICGASVGDSEAWLVTPEGWFDLTSRQRRKPCLGVGFVEPVSFRRPNPGGVLIVGSDGLFKYAPAAAIRDAATRGTPESACRTIVDLVRLPNGKLQDDIAVVVCHLSRQQ